LFKNYLTYWSCD